MIPAGTYSAIAVKAELGETSTGKEQVGVEFEITTAGEHTGNRITWYGFFTEKTEKRTLESLRICGWVGNDITNLSTVGIAAPVVEIVVEHDTYNGKTSAKVAWVNRGGGLSMKNQLSPEKKRAFAARLRGPLAAIDQELKASGLSTPPAANRSGPPAGHPASEDIPF